LDIKLLFKKYNKKLKVLLILIIVLLLAIVYIKKSYYKKNKYVLNDAPITALHKLKIKVISNIAEGHLALLSSDKNEIKFLHLSLGAPLSKKSKNGCKTSAQSETGI
jgi:hypothetical protein